MCFFGLNTWWLCFGLIWFFFPCTVFVAVVCFIHFNTRRLYLLFCTFVCVFLCASSFALTISSFTYFAIVELFLVTYGGNLRILIVLIYVITFAFLVIVWNIQANRSVDFFVGYAMNSQEMMINKSIGWRSFYALLSESCSLMVQGVRNKMLRTRATIREHEYDWKPRRRWRERRKTKNKLTTMARFACR